MGTVKNNSDDEARDEINASEAAFLALLERDIIDNPNRLVPMTRDENLSFLLKGVEADFDLDLLRCGDD